MKVADLEHDCFDFDLAAHPDWEVVTSTPLDVELEHAHRNTEVVLLFDETQITVDLALVGAGSCGGGWSGFVDCLFTSKRLYQQQQ